MPANDSPQWTVSAVIPESQDVTSLILEAPPGVSIRHAPGQFATIRARTDQGWGKPHPFTISCDSGCDTLRFTIKSVGGFTSTIRDLKPGDQLRCDGPYGAFCKDIEAKDPIVMIAGGVGVTPFLSVLRTFRNRKANNRMTLFWSNKTLADVFASDELAAMTRELDLTVVHALTRETPGPDLDSARVHYLSGRLTPAMLIRFSDPAHSAVYLCGPPPMQETLLALLADLGVPRDAVQRETFG